jgi:hypothetical protein
VPGADCARPHRYADQRQTRAAIARMAVTAEVKTGARRMLSDLLTPSML